MGCHGPLACSARTIAIQHLPAPPAGQPHEIALPAATRKPAVRERVPQLVWVEPIAEPGLPSPLADDLRDSAVRETPLSTDP